MKKNLPNGANKSCAFCEHARKITISGELLCTKNKDLKRVSPDDVCRSFSFDILEYRPLPKKQAEVLPKTDNEII